VEKIKLYDTTLRDGMQAEGISFSLEDKLAIARCLDELGVDYIEGGYTASNPKEMQFFSESAGLGLSSSRIATLWADTWRQCPIKATSFFLKQLVLGILCLNTLD